MVVLTPQAGIRLRPEEPFAELSETRAYQDILAMGRQEGRKAAETAIQGELAKRWQSWMLKAIRDALVAGFFAVGFAGIGQSAPQRPTLLWQLFSLFHRRGRPARSRQANNLGIPDEWLSEDDPMPPPAKGPRRTP